MKLKKCQKKNNYLNVVEAPAVEELDFDQGWIWNDCNRFFNDFSHGCI